jgi:hypothetical protein
VNPLLIQPSPLAGLVHNSIYYRHLANSQVLFAVPIPDESCVVWSLSETHDNGPRGTASGFILSGHHCLCCAKLTVSLAIEKQRICLYIYGACRGHILGSVDENGIQGKWLRSILKKAKDHNLSQKEKTC